jgi:glycine/D-amino acid oxidase-like deaminating enzyme
VALGVKAEMIGSSELHEIAPAMAPDIPGAIFVAEEAQDDGGRLVLGFARAAERRGAVVVRDVEVLEVLVKDGRVSGILTRQGEVHAGTVVLAAGMWTAELCRRIGVGMPITAIRAQVLATEPLPFGLGPVMTGPGAILTDIFEYVREGGVGVLPGYAEATSLPDPRMSFTEYACQTARGSYYLGCPTDASYRVNPDLNGVAEICRTLPLTFPLLSDAAVQRVWAGLIPYTPDGMPIIDRVEGTDGLIIAAGHQNGNTTGPASGQLVADLALGEPLPEWSSGCALDRFSR